MAALLSYGGSPAYASRLKQAAQLALTGADPRRAEEPQPCPSWRADATAAVRALIAGRFAEVHARLAARPREGQRAAARMLTISNVDYARHPERGWVS